MHDTHRSLLDDTLFMLIRVHRSWLIVNIVTTVICAEAAGPLRFAIPVKVTVDYNNHNPYPEKSVEMVGQLSQLTSPKWRDIH